MSCCSILIPAPELLQSMIHTDRSCMLECSRCNRIFCLEDTFQVAQIKNPGMQNPCLENATDLIGPNLCLCVGCYQATEKQTSAKNRSKRDCIIMNCDQTACHIFDSKLKDELNTFLINKINFRVLNNEEESLHKICFCNTHYDQILLITQCQLCGNRSMHKYQLHEDNVSEYQLILDEDNIPVTMKYGILICNPCHVYILLRRDKTTTITCELKKLIDASKTRIINKNMLKTKGLERIQLANNEINMNKKEENNKLLMVTSLPTNRRNFSTADSSIPSNPVSSVLALNTITTPPLLVNSTAVATSIQSVTTVITTTIGTALATEEASLTTITQPIVKTPMTCNGATEDLKLIVKIGKLTALTLKRKRQPTFLDEHFSVPRTKKYVVNRLTVTTDCKNHTMPDHKPTLPVQKSTIPSVKPTNPVDKPIIPIHKPSFQVVKPTAKVDKSMIPDNKRLYNKSLVFSPVLRPIFSSKWPAPKKYKTIPESSSIANKPTQLQTNLSLQNTLDLRSTSPRTKLHELSCQRTGTKILSSATLDMIQEIKVPIDKLTTADHKHLYNKSMTFSPAPKPFFSPNSTVLKKKEKHPEPVSPIKKPTQLETIQSYQNMLDSRSTSSRTEFSELNCQRVSPTILPPITPDMNQLVENLNISVDKPTIADRKPLDKNGKSPESVSLIKEPTQQETIQSYQNTLDSRSTSSRTEFSELNCERDSPTILPPITPDMNQLVENLNISVDKPTIDDNKPLGNELPVFLPVVRPSFNSKCTVLEKKGESPESVSPIKESTQLETNQSYQNTLDSQSTSSRTEFPELSHQRTGPILLLSTTTDMNKLVENLNISVDKPTIADDKPLGNESPVFSPVVRPSFNSKCTVLEKKGESPESVSPIKESTQLETNQSYQNTLDSQSTSSRTEFPELSHQRAGPILLLSTTTDMNQLVENLNISVDKPTIADDKPLSNESPVFSPVVRSSFSSKCSVLDKNGKSPESVSLIKEPTQLETNQSYQNTLDSRSTSSRTEFSELNCERDSPTILPPVAPDMNQLVENLNISVDKPTIFDHNPLSNESPVFSPVVRSSFSSKCSVLDKNGKSPESVSLIKEPTQLETNQSYQNTLDSRSTSSRTEFSELNCERDSPTILPPVAPDMNQLVENLNISVDKPTIFDHNPLSNESLVFSPIVRPFLSSKCSILDENGKSPESVSLIIEPTQLETNQSYQNTLDSQSTSSRTEFPELCHPRAGPTTLLSTTPDMIQLFKNLKTPYPNGIAFINHLLNLETCRNLGTLTVGNNKTTYRQRTSNTATTSNHNLQCSPEHEEY